VRSPDEAKRNPGFSSPASTPDYASLHPGYDILSAVIARSSCDEAIQTVTGVGFWIASAFAEASADKSLRSQ